MKDTFTDARLVSPDTIRLVIFSSLPWEKIDPALYVDYIHKEKLTLIKSSSMSGVVIADYRMTAPHTLGHSYNVIMPSYGTIPLDVSECTAFPGFEEKYDYFGDDLGALYTPEETRFALWAPLASRVFLMHHEKDEDSFLISECHRGDKGVYRIALKGDHEGMIYRYAIINNEITTETSDPYAKASTLNGENSVVVDFKKLQTDFHHDALPVLNSPCDAIIYEAHIRDMTIDKHTNIEHKGTFKGLSEPGRTTDGGHPAGLDYIASLGITHLQLLPIYDYKSVDERNPESGYNWGYDPAQYFVPEGSYASVLEDPLSRIKDLKALVSSLHERGIRVVMDVVYNHVYEYQTSVFERVVPNYYFRRRSSGKMANTSGCGDDFATERPMARKLILDACKWWIEQYGIDGFRFDLMGIMDCETLNLIKDLAKAHDKSFILYGEGWDMGGEVNQPLGTYGNARLLPDFAFFNDAFRESLKRYLAGDEEAMQPFKAAYVGSCLDFIVNKRFETATQSLNYIECHDNDSIYDYLTAKRPDLSEEERLRLVSLGTAGVLLAFGIPFIHMGQEIGQSKWGDGNTYNKGDHYNKFSYKLLDQRYRMYDYFKAMVAFRKTHLFLHVFDPRVIDQMVNLTDLGDILHVRFLDKNAIAPLGDLEFFINPTEEEGLYEEECDHALLYDDGGLLPKPKVVRAVSIPKHALAVTTLLPK
jgi:pullulanase